jgi:REP-associated tyrosine transposase
VSRPSRKSIRLASAVYTEPGRPFSVTIGTSPRAPVFADVPFGRPCVGLLRDVRERRGLLVYAYCLMPDHVHLLAAMTSHESLTCAIRSWKSLCYQERHKRGDDARFWQRSFYDHAIRDNEGIFDVAMYILMNPVRAGLVRDFHDYPLCGSFEFNV